MGAKCCSERKPDVLVAGAPQAAPATSTSQDAAVVFGSAEDLLKKYDQDKNGKLDITELASFFRDVAPIGNDSKLKLDTLMQMIDADGDGKVSLNEVRAFLRCYNPQSKTIKTKTKCLGHPSSFSVCRVLAPMDPTQ